MSDQSNGHGERATVALVNSKIDTVLAKVEGQEKTTEAHFETIKARLDVLGSLTGRLDTMEMKQTALEAQMSELQRGRTYRTTTLPPILLGIAALAVSVVAIVLTGHP